jgi:sporulation protein YlmC with PRC-barrel domain
VEAPDQMGTLRALEEREARLTGLHEDLRSRDVRDVAGDRIGTIEQLLVDDRENQVRLLLVTVSDCEGGENTQVLIPVDAITGITPATVWIRRTRRHVVGSPSHHCGRMDQRYLESVYAHYGYYPYWPPGYVFPSYQG